MEYNQLYSIYEIVQLYMYGFPPKYLVGTSFAGKGRPGWFLCEPLAE